MENAKKLDRFDDSTVESLVKEKIDAVSAKRIKGLRQEITQLIDEACGDREPGKRKEFESRLEQELKTSSINGLNMLSTTVEVYRDNVNKTMERYFGMVEQRKYDHLFVNRPGRDARALYKQEFLEASDSKREKLLSDFASYMAEQQKTFEELASYVSPETISRMRRSERIRLLMYVKGCGRLLDENKELFSESEVAEIKDEMADCTSPLDQQKIMTRIAGNLEKRKWYKKVYDRLPTKYKQIWGNIDNMSLAERQHNYEKLVVQIEEEYEHKLDNHPDRKHIGAQDRATALAYVRSDKISGGDKFRALKGLEKQIQQQKKEVSMPFEASLKELQQYKTPREIKRLRDQFYNGETYEQRKELAENIKTELLNAQAESNERQELMTDYKRKLEQDLASKIIGKKTLKAALKRAEKQSNDELHHTLVIYKPDRERRVKLLTQFKALPKEIQDKNTDFFELTHTERVMRMEELSQFDQEKNKEETQERPEKPLEKTVEENKEQQDQIKESQEENENKHIEQLMANAAGATRRQEYKKAIQYYQEILALDPNDQLAKISLEFVEGKLQQAEKQPHEETDQPHKQELTEAEKNRINQATNEALKNAAVMTNRRRNSMTAKLNKNLAQSQAKHGSGNLKGKTKNSNVEDQQLAKQVLEKSGNNKMLVNGEVSDVIYYSEEGVRDSAERERKIEKQLAKEGAHGATMDNIVAYKGDGSLSNAGNAQRKLKNREQETEELIKTVAKSKLKVDASKEEALEAALQKEVSKKDLSVKLRAA